MPECNVTETAAARARCVAYLTVGCSTLASMTVLLMQAIPMLLGAGDTQLSASTRSLASGSSIVWSSSPLVTSVEVEGGDVLTGDISTFDPPPTNLRLRDKRRRRRAI
jgi:hypothetical protein